MAWPQRRSKILQWTRAPVSEGRRQCFMNAGYPRIRDRQAKHLAYWPVDPTSATFQVLRIENQYIKLIELIVMSVF